MPFTPPGLDPIYEELDELVLRVLATQASVDPVAGAEDLLAARLRIAAAAGALGALYKVGEQLDASVARAVIPPAVAAGPATALREALVILERAPHLP